MIQVEHLTKWYGQTHAVKDLSFEIGDTGVYGFLGPNGAGKSTTLNMLTGCLSPTEGKITIGGFDILEEPKQAKKCIGYLPEIPPLYMDMTVTEYLNFVYDLKKVKLNKNPDAPAITTKRDEIKVIKDAKIKLNREEIAALKDLED